MIKLLRVKATEIAMCDLKEGQIAQEMEKERYIMRYKGGVVVLGDSGNMPAFDSFSTSSLIPCRVLPPGEEVIVAFSNKAPE